MDPLEESGTRRLARWRQRRGDEKKIKSIPYPHPFLGEADWTLHQHNRWEGISPLSVSVKHQPWEPDVGYRAEGGTAQRLQSRRVRKPRGWWDWTGKLGEVDVYGVESSIGRGSFLVSIGKRPNHSRGL